LEQHETFDELDEKELSSAQMGFMGDSLFWAYL
jgi:hypothetical protein